MTAMTATVAPSVPVEFTANDRCDSCTAQAYLRFTLEDGHEFQFCGHHGGRHESVLVAAGASVYSELWKLDKANHLFKADNA